MKRAIRRHHRRRLFKKRLKRSWWVDRKLIREQNQEYINVLKYIIDTPTPCSCTMCGNPRKYFRVITKDEQLSLFNMMEQCNDAGIYTKWKTNNLPPIEY